MEPYRNAMEHILQIGEEKEDRTGVGTIEVFGLSMRFPYVGHRFPLLTGKVTHWPSILHELIWFLRGDTNIQYLSENKVKIWDEWADENGNLGPIYGSQWRNFGGEVDQIEGLIQGINKDPFSRRHIVSAWNVGQLSEMALPPCHYAFQFGVSSAGRLDLIVNQRSADMFLGVPFNIASYATLMYIIADITNKVPGHLMFNLGSAHIYRNHMDQVRELLNRNWPVGPELVLKRKLTNTLDLDFEDFELRNYNPLPKISAPVAV